MRHPVLLSLALGLAASSRAGSLAPSDFTTAAPQGFGDRQNSLPWSMLWWEKYQKLFVGTGRATACTDAAALELFWPFLSLYPPRDRDVECAPDPRDLPLRAEIWSWSAPTGAWTMVVRSPDDLAIPAHPGKFVARDVGFRGMQLFTEPDGTEALYVGGVSARPFDEASRSRYLTDPELPPPRILRSTDGETFEPIPQDPSSLWYRLNPLAGFRGMASYKERLYIVASAGLLGHGRLLEAADPARGNDAFRRIPVGPEDLPIFEIATFNGFLYAGTGGQPLNGDPPFSVWKTDASGPLPYTFRQIVPPGAFRPGRPAASAAAISMLAFGGRLYVGTEQELFRINPDDSWDLVVGAPRTTPEGTMVPLSGLGDGFASNNNVLVWRMAEHGGLLHVGTLDAGTVVSMPGLRGAARADVGFDLYSTPDGWHFTRVTRTGLSDPAAGTFDQGLRALASTPHGLFVGSANPFYGLNLWRGVEGERAIEAPARLEAEAGGSSLLLSWETPAGAARFHVLRDTASSAPAEVRVAGPYAVEDVRVAVDRRAGWSRASYQVVAEDATGHRSEASNLAPWPSPARPVDFAMVASAFARWGAAGAWSAQLDAARAATQAGDYAGARRILRTLLATVDTESALPAWRTPDVRALVGKLVRRLVLVQLGLLPPAALGVG